MGRVSNCDSPFWEGMNAERPGGNQSIFSKTHHYQCQKPDLATREQVCVCVCVQQLQGPTNLTREDCKDELVSIYRELDLKDLASIKMSLLLSWALLQNMQKAQINTGRT